MESTGEFDELDFPPIIAETIEENDSTIEENEKAMPFSSADLATTVSVLEAVAADVSLLRCKPLRKFRCLVEEVGKILSSKKFGGLSREEAETRRDSRLRLNCIKSRAKHHDKKFLDNTLLRAGRMQHLRTLLDQEPVLHDDNQDEITHFRPAINDDENRVKNSPLEGGDPHIERDATSDNTTNTVLPMIPDGVGADTTALEMSLSSSSSHSNNNISHHNNIIDNYSNQTPSSTADASVDPASAFVDSSSLLELARSCYACKARFHKLHHYYHSLCPTCADLNWKKRHQIVDLKNRIFLVTGARVKIGFHIVLKLLRCGAKVIALSRFPHDAAERFASQPDSSSWLDRLHIYGLDLRDLGALEVFCSMVNRDYPRLDGIINNACQTVRRPPAYYSSMIDGESKRLVDLPMKLRPLVERNHAYEVGKRAWLLNDTETNNNNNNHIHNDDIGTRVTTSSVGAESNINNNNNNTNGSTITTTTTLIPTSSATIPVPVVGGIPVSVLPSALQSQIPILPGDSESHDDRISFPVGIKDVNGQQVDLRTHHSWRMRLHEVPIPELVEVMAVNSAAPFILNARLKPLMMKGNDDESWRLATASKQQKDEDDHEQTQNSSNKSTGGEEGAGAGIDEDAANTTNSDVLRRSKSGGNNTTTTSLAEALLLASSSSSSSSSSSLTTMTSKTTRSNATIATTAKSQRLAGTARGKPVGGANRRPQNGRDGGVHGDSAQHGVPAERCRFIVNVSAMEGKFYRAKTSAHPHTNMAKAALNMMTRTSAADYAESYIYMTAVDTGWINDENPLHMATKTAATGFMTPLDEIDAAARVCDPIIAPLLDAKENGGICSPQYGCFLKDFFVTEW